MVLEHRHVGLEVSFYIVADFHFIFFDQMRHQTFDQSV